MKLWTYHPSDFDLINSKVVYAATGGNVSMHERPAYSSATKQLYQRLGTDQFIWCSLTEDPFTRIYEHSDLMEWHIELPFECVWKFLRSDEWNRIRVGSADRQDWERLFVESPTEADVTNTRHQALLRFPISYAKVNCVGKAPMINSREAKLRLSRVHLSESNK